MFKLPHTKSCFVCGLQNPGGLRLDFETDGTIVRTSFAFQPGHAGFRLTVHGGLISTVLDEVMVWACGVRTRRFAYCAELNVRFVEPARPGEELVATGELVNDRRGRLFEARGDLRNPAGRILATATGKYLPVQAADWEEMLSDFAEDARRFFQA